MFQLQEPRQVFDKYASLRGNKKTLSKAELKIMIEEEIPEILKDPEDLDHVFNTLDINKDGEVTSDEFMEMITVLSCPCQDQTSNEETESLHPGVGPHEVSSNMKIL